MKEIYEIIKDRCIKQNIDIKDFHIVIPIDETLCSFDGECVHARIFEKKHIVVAYRDKENIFGDLEKEPYIYYIEEKLTTYIGTGIVRLYEIYLVR